jgi:uracil-DNA glycosylase
MAGDVERLRAYVEYFRDMGVHDFYRRGEPVFSEIAADVVAVEAVAEPLPVRAAPVPVVAAPVVSSKPDFLEPPIAKLVRFDDLAPLPEVRVAAAGKADALRAIQEEIGDCTRCPLAYAGRRKIVFADGDPNARLMFVRMLPGFRLWVRRDSF